MNAKQQLNRESTSSHIHHIHSTSDASEYSRYNPAATVKAIVCLTFLLLPIPAAAQWPTTSWNVLCTDTTATRVSGATPCDDRILVGSAGKHRKSLEAASQWLEKLGFRPPNLTQKMLATNQPYFAQIADEELGWDVGGMYRTPQTPEEKGVLYLSSSIAGEALEAESVHELFHAVQQAYYDIGLFYGDPFNLVKPYTPTIPQSRDYHWITEGTADAIRIAFQNSTSNTSTGRPPRYYNHPLYDPCPDCSPKRQALHTYYTANFWLNLGKMLGSTDRIAYLETLWKKISNDPDTAHHGILPLDNTLRDVSGEGLAEHFPAFIARYANDEVKFSTVEKLVLQQTTNRVSKVAEVAPFAADAYRVQIHVTPGEESEIEIALAKDHPDLHLIVDGQRWDKAAGKDRNTYRVTLNGRDKPYGFLVRVANVAANVIETSEQTYALRITGPQPPLAGNMHAAFSGTLHGHLSSLGRMVSHGEAHWQVVLDIQTQEPRPDIDPFPTEEGQIIYPDDNSRFQLRGNFKYVTCETDRPDNCYLWTEESYQGSGGITAKGGKMNIYRLDDEVWMEITLPVHTNWTNHYSGRKDEIAQGTQHWQISCRDHGQWWATQLVRGHAGHVRAMTSPLMGTWRGEDYAEIDFKCSGQWNDSTEASGIYSSSMKLEGRVKVQPQRRLE